jgi:phosphoserine phosphatase
MREKCTTGNESKKTADSRESRAPRLVCFDLDGTLIDGTIYIWKTLYEAFVDDKELQKKMTEDYFSGKISYEEWFHHDIATFKACGVTRDKVVRCINSLTLMKGARETLAELKKRGYILALISGSLRVVLDELFPDHPFDHVLINEIHFNEEGEITGGTATPYDVEKKGEGLSVLARREGITTDQCVFIGDNENDLSIARIAGFSIAFNCKSENLAKIANLVIMEKDLRAILPYL